MLVVGKWFSSVAGLGGIYKGSAKEQALRHLASPSGELVSIARFANARTAVGGTSWEMNSLPDTPTARELASALVDDIMGEFEACSGKGVDLLQTDIAEGVYAFAHVADYRLPPSNHSFGLTVETVIEEDERASIREYRHYLLEVYKDGPIGTQTDLRPRDELLEVNGVILYGKDSEMVRRTLTSASSSGYIVCARPQVGGPFPAEVTPFSIIEEENEEDITVDASSPTNLFDTTDDTFDSTSTELSKAALAPRTAKPTEETVFSAVFAPGPAVPSQSDRTPSPLLVPIPAAASDVKTEVPAVSMPGTAVPTDKQSRVPSSPEHVAPPTKDELPDFYDDEQPLIITKREAELLGLQLGPPVDKSWGFPITEIAPGGPLYRLINTPRSGFLAPNVQVGDEVVEVNGRRLKGLRIFTVRSILWDLVPFEGEVRNGRLSTPPPRGESACDMHVRFFALDPNFVESIPFRHSYIRRVAATAGAMFDMKSSSYRTRLTR
ncbi:unnamed protein product [Schistocephalus solidus]|uniref:PDZ domain-containing protein n=1 Tax=Schistocephalus solidus TaxID=70667 RepID=A0A183T1F3_SCHSO|nr:unnamed protein product [Schistocephalus solidus]